LGSSGIIDASELRTAFKNGGFDFPLAVIERLMRHVDAPAGVSLPQFFTLSSLLASIREAFRQADLDNNGGIDHKELGKLLIDLGHNLTSAEIDNLMTAADTDRSGQIEFLEFVQLYSHVLLFEKDRAH
jgi:Ca2+-binding EF-hand superfamily protein